jgi:hypothetical protein
MPLSTEARKCDFFARHNGDNPGYSYKSREKMDSNGYKGVSGYKWAVMFERMPVYTSVL